MEIVGNVKNYEWGKLGRRSVVAQLALKNSDNLDLREDTAYSELWMGCHPSGPAQLKATGALLSKDLPFLFKVLSIRKALSVQVHPNKFEAIRLHNERPDLYKDINHKPELAIALTSFQALVGFRPYEEIYNFCMELPPLIQLLGGEEKVQKLANGTNTDLRSCYEQLMKTEQSEVARCTREIGDKYFEVLHKHHLRDIYQKMNQDFPGDVGVLSIFFLNLIKLNPGEAIYLPANEIHAYLSGDCIECMACSDNVVRAGLTPKYKDVETLLKLLNYEGHPARKKIFKPVHLDEYVRLFAPPVDDFAVAEINLPKCATTYKFDIQASDVILLVVQGERSLRTSVSYDLSLQRGSIVYIPSEAAPQIEFFVEPGMQSEDEFVAYIASRNGYKVIPSGC